jgi:hypothetical protein
MVDFKFVFGV